MTRKIEVVPYDPGWPEVYRKEMDLISGGLGLNMAAAHHIGSTAVPGLAAKATIDILLVMRDLEALDASNAFMIALGYQPKGENGIAGRRYFNKVAGDEHLFHIHAFGEGHPDIKKHLDFREYLIAHPSVAREYQSLKKELAARFKDEPSKYTKGKADFISTVIMRAGTWREKIEQADEVYGCIEST